MSVMDWDGSMAGWCAEAGAEVSALGLSTPSVLPRTSVPAAAGVAEDPWFPEDSGSEDDDSSEDDENEYVAVHIDRSFEPPELAAAAPGSRAGSRCCEDCKSKHPSYGTLAEKTRRWCAACGKTHGAVSLISIKHKCEDCNKRPSYSMPGEWKARWCAGCGKNHGVVRGRTAARSAEVALSKKRKDGGEDEDAPKKKKKKKQKKKQVREEKRVGKPKWALSAYLFLA